MSGRILVVDDSLTIRMDLLATLEAARLDAVACATIAEARQALAAEPHGLVILDVLLPDGDGIDLLQEMRNDPELRDTPVMLLSSEAEVADRVRGMQTGADEYVGKPYDPSFLVARARELLRGRPGSGAAAGAGDENSDETILVIDDSITFRQALKEMLERAAYRVLLAGSGEEGLRVAAERQPTAIIVDGEMPDINGATVIRRIRLDGALRGTPCILLTGSEGADAELHALDSGADAFVRKEEDPGVVLARVTAALRSASFGSRRRHGRSLLAPKRVLLVDNDGEDYAQTVAGELRSAGYEAAVAHSGEAGLELLAAQPVDCVLLARNLPGMTGDEACRCIKAAPAIRHIPVILLTGADDSGGAIVGLAAGADDVIPKSADFDLLRARVLAQLRRKQFVDEERLFRDELLRRELEAAEERRLREVAETRAALVEELERKNRELEAFSYSVSHDLRAPLRGIDGFSQALIEDYGDTLPAAAQDYLRRVRAGAQRMGELIDDLLQLSRVGRAPMRRQPVDLSATAAAVVEALQRGDPDRQVDVRIADGVTAEGDPGLLRAMLENLLGNAWKFTAKAGAPTIEFYAEREGDRDVYTVRDNGAGFDMAFADRLFSPFQRLHTVSEFPGTGIGLATVNRIVDRHGGRVWAEAEVGKGAAFHWTLSSRAEGNS